MSKNQRAMHTARTIVTFCSGFAFATAVVAILYKDWNGLAVGAGIFLILIGAKEVLLRE